MEVETQAQWASSEKKYESGNVARRGLLNALKKFRYYLYEVRFWVEIDTSTSVHQLNQSALNLPGPVVNTSLAWIRMFTFDIKRVAGRKHSGPARLSRRG